MIDSNEIKGLRLAGIDFGLARLGVAVCDEYHVTVTPVCVLDPREESFWTKLITLLTEKAVKALVIGLPIPQNNAQTELMDIIRNFGNELQSKTGLVVYYHDESFSSKRAAETMVSIGKKKKDRRTKGALDRVAAAVILRSFLEEIEGGFYA